MMTFKVNFQFPAPNGQLRTQALLIPAKTPEEAKKKAEEQISANHEQYKVGKVGPWV